MKRSLTLLLFMCSIPCAIFSQTLKPGDFILKVADNETGEIRQQTVSFSALQSMHKDTVTAEGRYSTDNWIGPEFYSLAEIIPFETGRIRRVVIKAEDGYMTVLASDLLASLEMSVLALEIEGIPSFPAVFGKWRFIASGLQPMYWVNGPNVVEIELGPPESPSGLYSIYLDKHPNWREWIKSKDLSEPLLIRRVLERFGIDIQRFHVLAIDGLFREYALTRPLYSMELASDENGYWKIAGEKIPKGLQTNGLFYISSSSRGIFLKESTAAELDLWEEHVLNGFILKNRAADNCVIELLHQDGHSSQTCKISQVYTGSLTFASFIQEVKKDFPDVVRIDIKW